MSGSSFWRGMIFGVLVGAAAVFVVNPQLKAETRAGFARFRQGLRSRAGRIFSRAQQEVDQAIDQVTS